MDYDPFQNLVNVPAAEGGGFCRKSWICTPKDFVSSLQCVNFAVPEVKSNILFFGQAFPAALEKQTWHTGAELTFALGTSFSETPVELRLEVMGGLGALPCDASEHPVDHVMLDRKVCA